MLLKIIKKKEKPVVADVVGRTPWHWHLRDHPRYAELVKRSEDQMAVTCPYCKNRYIFPCREQDYKKCTAYNWKGTV